MKSAISQKARDLFFLLLTKNQTVREWSKQFVASNDFSSLEINIPLNNRLRCPIINISAISSFSEIFIQQSYGKILEYIDPPLQWIDIGSHMGYFSLWILTKHNDRQPNANLNTQCLLIDGDRRALEAFTALSTTNNFNRQFQFLNGVISNDDKAVVFYERSGMASSIYANLTADDYSYPVPVCTPLEIEKSLPGKIDLIKIDIEGAESHFVNRYTTVIERTASILLEWHSWSPGGRQAIRSALIKMGFSKTYEIEPSHPIMWNGIQEFCGTDLYCRT